MAQSETLEPLRNDGRGVHHRLEFELAIARVEAKLRQSRLDLEALVARMNIQSYETDFGVVDTIGGS